MRPTQAGTRRIRRHTWHALFLLAPFIACDDTSTTFMMRRTVDLHARFGATTPSVLTGFQLGGDLDAPVRTRAEARVTATLPAAGAESPPCNDGTAHVRRVTGDPMFVGDFVSLIGDTGAEDISTDRDCGCDTHISRMSFTLIRMVPSLPNLPDLGSVTLGKADFCPNTLDDLVVGDTNLDGQVEVTMTAVLEVRGGRLMLDVTYEGREVD